MRELKKEYKDLIEKISTENPNFIFTGSLALYLRGKIDRHPTDLDIITDRDYYTPVSNMNSDNSLYLNERMECAKDSDRATSHTIEVDGVMISKFGCLFNDIKVDFFYKPVSTNYTYDLNIRLEPIETIIKYKIDLLNKLYGFNLKSFKKHLNDLINILEKDQLLEVVSNLKDIDYYPVRNIVGSMTTEEYETYGLNTEDLPF